MRAAFPTFRPRWAVWLGVFCIALVLMSGVVQAAHFHAYGQTDHECALCLAIHHVAQTPSAVAVHFDSRAVTAPTVGRCLQRPRRAVFFRLVSRPPPLDSAFSA